MKKLFTFLVIVCSVSLCKAQWVTIPDANFVSWLQAHYPTCMNGNQMNTSCGDIVGAIGLNCEFQNISDLTGIQYFIHLKYLDCEDNMISYIPSLPNTLEFFTCMQNSLTSLPLLPNSLKEIYIGNNFISSIPSLPANLEVFSSFWANPFTTLPPLPSSLKELYCEHGQLQSLPPLPSGLERLICDDNQLTSLPVLPTGLITLNCSDNQISTLPALPSSLQELDCSYNPPIALSPLPNGLLYFNCNGNQFTSLPSLPSSLLTLGCSNNILTSFPSLPSNLVSLICSHNILTSLPLLPASLLGFDCAYNQLSSIPPLPDTLWSFKINNNSISCMPVLNHFIGSDFLFNISNTSISCFPNVIQHTGSIPAIDTMPICSCVYPSGITTTNITATSAKVNWSAECCSEYRIQYRVTGTTSWITKVAAPPLTTKTLTGLAAGTTYDLKMKVVCTNGTSNSTWSPIQTFTTTISCTAPTNLTASNLSQTQATVNWSTVAGAYSYKLVKRKLGTTAWSTSIILAPATSKLLTGLTANTTYQYRLQTICNASGTPASSWTAIHTFTTMLRLEDESTEVDLVALNIYPNPFSNDFEVNVSGAESDAVISVYNIIGQQQLRIALEPHNSFISETISLSGYAAGVYIVSVTVNDETFIRKIVKE